MKLLYFLFHKDHFFDNSISSLGDVVAYSDNIYNSYV